MTYPTCTECGHGIHYMPCAVDVITSRREGMRFDPCDCIAKPELEEAS